MVYTKIQPKIVITSPSLDSKQNVSGISTITRLLIELNDNVKYQHYLAGRSDSEKFSLKWLLRQILMPIDFYKTLKKSDASIIHINMPLESRAIFRDSILVLTAKLNKKHTVLHLHGGRYSNEQKIPLIFKLILNRIFKYSNKILTLGDNEKQTLSRVFNIDNHKLEVFQNAVKVDRRISLSKPGKLNLLFIGRIDRNKGLLELVEAVSIFCKDYDVIMRVAGDGIDLCWFLDLANSKIPHNFVYLGKVDGEERESLFLKSDVLVLPSYYEGLPLALLEAMSFGLVPVVTPVGSIPEVTTNNENGLIVGVRDSHSIVQALKRLIRDPALMVKLRINARLTIQENYSISKYIERLNDLYYSL